MGSRSKVTMLPAAVRAELDRRIVERAFSGYQDLAEWLQAQGYRIADDSVQRYGARLRRQLETIDLARHQAQALAAAGIGAGDTAADGLTAISVQLIQQQVLSTLLEAAQPESSDQAESTGGEAKTLDVRDLQRLTRIIVDLNRVTHPRHANANQSNSPTNREAAEQSSARPQHKDLPEKTYQAIRNALLTGHPLEAPQPEPAATPAEPVALAEAHPSALEAAQPDLTAAHRTYPHQNIYRIALDTVTSQVWPSVVRPKLVGFSQPLSGAEPTGAPSDASDESAESLTNATRS